uniref:Uncharacterized protein MANES_05G042200 n=1 Tax=Rhizophora mucronata TaxID=61149 RepID=A0A2P2LH25_RHIMU
MQSAADIHRLGTYGHPHRASPPLRLKNLKSGPTDKIRNGFRFKKERQKRTKNEN